MTSPASIKLIDAWIDGFEAVIGRRRGRRCRWLLLLGFMRTMTADSTRNHVLDRTGPQTRPHSSPELGADMIGVNNEI